MNLDQVLHDLLHNSVFWVTLLVTFVIPFLNAALTHVAAHDGVKSVITLVLAGVYALVAWLTNLGGVVDDWSLALGVFITAVLGAGGINAAIVRGKVRNDIAAAVPIKLGKPKYYPQPDQDAA
jgi:hypothetical protein